MKKGQELSSWPRPRATGILHWCFVHFKIGGTASLAHSCLLPYQGKKIPRKVGGAIAEPSLPRLGYILPELEKWLEFSKNRIFDVRQRTGIDAEKAKKAPGASFRNGTTLRGPHSLSLFF